MGKMSGTLESLPYSRERIQKALREHPQEVEALAPQLRSSAVLVPIVERAESMMLFTRRTEHLSSHAGQICFPGGRVHPDDETLIGTALREMQEEIGVPPGAVEIGGFLDSFETLVSGFRIFPVVGFLGCDFVLSVNSGEVAEVFEAPLSYILDPKNHARRSWERNGVVREFFAIEYGHHTIWGATAAMIVNLSERLGLR